MGLPQINIVFRQAADDTIRRLTKGVVALIVRDAAVLESPGLTLTAESQIPAALGTDNRAFIRRAFTGYVNRPRKVLIYVVAPTAEDGEEAAGAGSLAEALAWLATQTFDYLVGPADVTTEEAREIADWVKGQRQESHAICKAVLPHLAANSEAVVNFTTTGIKAGGVTYTTQAYCSRIAGLLAGTPMESSSTYAVLDEVTEIDRLSDGEANGAVDRGELILIHDGEKVKVALGVNSLTTPGKDQTEDWKQIRTVEICDMIRHDLRVAAQDSWVGKYANSYDNRCVLMTAIKDYLSSLETADILAEGASQVEIDLEGVKAYLEAHGVSTAEMTEQELREADTGNDVFILVTLRILGVVTNITIKVSM